MTDNRGRLIGALALGWLTLSACGSNELGDLQEWVAEAKAQNPGNIQSMPDIRPYQPFTYDAESLRSPFANVDPDFESRLLAVEEGCDLSLQPNPSRREQELEKYGLDALKMVGVIGQGQNVYGLVKVNEGESKGVVHRVTIGDYMGLNDGHIKQINDDRIVLESLIPNGRGCWEKRDQLLLVGQ